MLGAAAIIGLLTAALALPGSADAASAPLDWGAPARVDGQPPFVNASPINSMACGSSTECVGLISGYGLPNSFDIVTSSDPGGGVAGDWSRPTRPVPADSSFQPTAVACGPGLCAVGGENDSGIAIATSTDPTGAGTWVEAPIVDPSGAPASDTTATLSAIQCPTSSECVAIDSSGRRLVYDGSDWTLESSSPLDFDEAADGLSCPTSGFCAIVDGAGEVYASNDPTDPTATWTAAATGVTGTADITCASASACVVLGYVEAGVETASTADADGPAPSWTAAAPDPALSTGVESLTCGATFCLAATVANGVAVAGPTGTGFTPITPRLDEPDAVGCAGTSLCVAATAQGAVSATTDPGAGVDAQWTAPAEVAPGANLVQLSGSSCPSATLCVGTDAVGHLLTGTPGSFTTAELDPATNQPGDDVELSAAQCPSASLCLADDGAANVFWTTDPKAGVSSWHETPTVAGGDRDWLTQLACPSSGLCVAIAGSPVVNGSGTHGRMLATTDPTGPASAWSVGATDLDPEGHADHLICPSTSLCIADTVDPGANGNVTGLLSTTSPADPDSWSYASGFDATGLDAIACAPRTTTCVAFDDAGRVRSSTDPAGGTGAWSGPASVSALASERVEQLDCVTATLCVGYTSFGAIVSSTDPTGGPAAWSVTSRVASFTIERLTCASVQLCVAVGTGGQALQSTDPAGGASAWTAETVDPGEALESVACAPAGPCAAGDFGGKIVEGRLAAAPVASSPTGSTPTTPTTPPTTTGPSPSTHGPADPTRGGATGGASGRRGRGGAGVATVSGMTVSERLSCAGSRRQRCTLTLALSTVPTHGRRAVVIASRTVTLHGGQRRRLALTLARRRAAGDHLAVTVRQGATLVRRQRLTVGDGRRHAWHGSRQRQGGA